MSPRSPDHLTAQYWDAIAGDYQADTRISTTDFHYGPLLPGDGELGLLPEDVSGWRCLEVGAGAGQNSIALARRGAHCTAIDIASRQVEAGRTLAKQAGVTIDFHCADMDEALPGEPGGYDLVHSTYALPFSRHPAELIQCCASLLRPGGRLLLTTGHPVYAGEWVDLGDEGEALLLVDYFHPPDDIRSPDDDHPGIRTRFAPLSTVTDWLRGADLQLDRLLEPEPLPIPLLSDEELAQRVPYHSPEWRELYPVLMRVPVVAIFSAHRPE